MPTPHKQSDEAVPSLLLTAYYNVCPFNYALWPNIGYTFQQSNCYSMRYFKRKPNHFWGAKAEIEVPSHQKPAAGGVSMASEHGFIKWTIAMFGDSTSNCKAKSIKLVILQDAVVRASFTCCYWVWVGSTTSPRRSTMQFLFLLHP